MEKSCLKQEVKRQSVWIVRYGLTKYPLVEYYGPFNSPLDPTEGIEHARAIAGKVRNDVLKFCSESGAIHVYSSPFTRTAQTAQIIAEALPGQAQVRVEEGLTEWQQKSLLVDPEGIVTYPRSKKELSEELKSIDLGYESVNPQASCSPNDQDVFVEESEEGLFNRCSVTLDGILKERANNGESFIIVSHAPCDQCMAVYFEGKALSESALPAWPLGGITKFSRTVYHDGSYGQWEMDYYGNTDHMPGIYRPGLKAWSLPLLAKVYAVEGNLDTTDSLFVSQ